MHDLAIIGLFLLTLIVSCESFDAPVWICLGNEIGSCYYKRKELPALSYDEAQQDCVANNGTLAMFPSIEEMEIVNQVITIEVKINLNGEKERAPHRFWVGAKWDVNLHDEVKNHSIYWENGHNAKRVLPYKWRPVYRFEDGDASIRTGSGCVIVEVYIEDRYVVKTRLRKVSCDIQADVTNFMCEKSDADDPNPTRWWQQWAAWPRDLCVDGSISSANRTRLCFSHPCELDGMTEQKQIRACCDAPPLRVPNGVVVKRYRNDYFGLTESRAIHNNTVTIVCNRGYVDPITRLSTIESTCQLNEYNEGRWLGAVPDECVIVDCGDPPLGVHAFPPQFTKTTFGSLATYWCQPGFKEPKNKKSSVTLRCDTEDSWIGLDFDRTTKAVCEPLNLVSMPWQYYSPSVEGGNDHCYKLNHTGTTWAEAHLQCDGGLLYIEEVLEMEFLRSIILEPQAERSVIWTAGRKDMDEMTFNWRLEDNTKLDIGVDQVNVRYMNWAPDHPVVTGHYHRDLCVAANYSDGQWFWVNVTCDNKFEFLCKTMKQKLHGDFSDWSQWTACDRQYIRRRSRTCTNPAPFCGGSDCQGETEELSHCCIDPGQAPYANLHYRGVTNDTVFLLPGHFYTYMCWFGYKHDDGSTFKNITCLENGTWSEPGEAPACSPTMCDDPVNGTHSYVAVGSLKKFPHGSRISYDCMNGFGTAMTAMPGIGKQVNCTDGNWSAPPLTCFARLCEDEHPTIADPADYDKRNINSTAVIRHKNNESHVSWGNNSEAYDLYRDIYQYFCQWGYRTVYKTTDYNLTCLSNGQWSREASFESDHHPIACEPVECPGPPPQAKPNSFWTSGSDPAKTNLRGKYKDTARYKCIEGYMVETRHNDKNKQEEEEMEEETLLEYTFTCGANNDWTDAFSPQQCIKQNCKDPGNGTNVQSRIGKSFLYKDKLDYVCKQGYVYDNSITRQRLICDRYNGSEYATWNGTELHCSKVNCGDPGIGSNVSKIGDSHEYADIVIYRCAEQHVLTGGGLEELWLRCGSGGSWNGTAPSCEPAEITSDFEVTRLKPYTVQASWIMSEKYKGVPIKFHIKFRGRPGYIASNGEHAYIETVPEGSLHNESKLYKSSESGLLKQRIFTQPGYVYEFRLESQSSISYEKWPKDQEPLIVYTGGGAPFVGAVQEANLPNVIPLTALPKKRTQPIIRSLDSADTVLVTFDRSMFSEQNGTIVGFSVIVKEVHPFHTSDSALAKEGYHDRYPNELFTYRELDVFTKYNTWPAFFATPLCNLFNPNETYQNIIGDKPSRTVKFLSDNISAEDAPLWIESPFKNFPGPDKLPEQEVSFIVGSDLTCLSHNRTSTCNGPMRRNRKFCIKLRAYNSFGWNDSMCSDIIVLKRVLEFDSALIVPTVLASLPFAIFCIVGIYIKATDTDGGDDDAEHDEIEGELVKAWSRDLQRHPIGYKSKSGVRSLSHQHNQSIQDDTDSVAEGGGLMRRSRVKAIRSQLGGKGRQLEIIGGNTHEH